MTRRRFQFSIAALLIATFVCAVFVRFWPWQLPIVIQAVLAVWTVFTLIQVPLLTWVWAGAPRGHERRRMLCYCIALPCCVLPIANWLFGMIAIIVEQNEVDKSNDIYLFAGLLAFILVSFYIVSLVVLPLSFVLVGIRRDPAFGVLRLLAFAILATPLVVVAIVGLVTEMLFS